MSKHFPIASFMFFALVISSVVGANGQNNGSTIDPAAQLVHLRKTCITAGQVYLDNCFETTTALTHWLWNSGRALGPSQNDRVHVQMGPGEFEPFECIGHLNDSVKQGWVSVHGSGSEASKFVRSDGAVGFSGACRGAIEINHCDGLEFDNLGAYGPTGAEWAGAGTGKWHQVDLIAETTNSNNCGVPFSGTLAWYDVPDGASEKSLQYFFSSRIWALGGEAVNLGNFAFDSLNAESWIYGSDIASLTKGSPSINASSGILLGAPADARVFGGTVRAVALSNHNGGIIAGALVNGGTLHMHGGIISVDSRQSNVGSTYGISAGKALNGTETAFVHTPGTAFAIQSNNPANTSRLIENHGSIVQSPFLWQASDTPPAAKSLHGQDIFVDTDADGNGQAHLMVRDNTCTGAGGPWRDMSTGACRSG